jgi:glycosyltransferase involved in cell wall biosynthesis
MPWKIFEDIDESSQDAPVVSIIIPFHDRREKLLELLHSIPDMSGIEIVAVNDHSTYAVDLPKVFEHAAFRLLHAPDGQRYAGLARNQGMRAARGAYLFFADSDDLLDKDAFRRCVQDLSEGRRVDVVYGRVGSFQDGDGAEGGRHVNVNWLLYEAARSGDRDFLFRLHAPWAKFVSRTFAVVQNLSFQDTVVSNDVIFNLKLCARASTWRILNDVIYRVREGNESLTSSTIASKEKIRIRFDVQEAYNAGLLDIGCPHLRSPGLVYIKAMWRRDKGAALSLTARCLCGPTPLLALMTTARFRILRRKWMLRGCPVRSKPGAVGSRAQ